MKNGGAAHTQQRTSKKRTREERKSKEVLVWLVLKKLDGVGAVSSSWHAMCLPNPAGEVADSAVSGRHGEKDVGKKSGLKERWNTSSSVQYTF